jgi:Ni,Fe-hydrogenase maturation factor
VSDERRATTDDGSLRLEASDLSLAEDEASHASSPTPQASAQLVVGDRWSALVIGYGNDLRGDDAAGPRVAELIGARELPGVRAIASRQLTPDLAEQLARADLAVFVDAYPAAEALEGRSSIIAIEAENAKYSQSHVRSAFDDGRWTIDGGNIVDRQRIEYAIACAKVQVLTSSPGLSRSSRLEYLTGAPDADAAIQLRRIDPAAGAAALGHSSDPCELLALALALYGHAPPAWLIAVPALTFDLGAPLSPTAARGVLAAVRQIEDLLTGRPGSVPAR